jgi:hypothetical protein
MRHKAGSRHTCGGSLSATDPFQDDGPRFFAAFPQPPRIARTRRGLSASPQYPATSRHHPRLPRVEEVCLIILPRTSQEACLLAHLRSPSCPSTSPHDPATRVEEVCLIILPRTSQVPSPRSPSNYPATLPTVPCALVQPLPGLSSEACRFVLPPAKEVCPPIPQCTAAEVRPFIYTATILPSAQLLPEACLFVHRPTVSVFSLDLTCLGG